jgi:hypothetical protein
MTKYRRPRCLTNLFHDPGGFIHKTALTLVGRNTRLSMRTIYALMWLSMRNLTNIYHFK